MTKGTVADRLNSLGLTGFAISLEVSWRSCVVVEDLSLLLDATSSETSMTLDRFVSIHSLSLWNKLAHLDL
jgi:hypothetical protein